MVETTKFKEIRTVILPFIREHGERRVSQRTLEHYKQFSIQKNDFDSVIVTQAHDKANVLVAVSLATVRNNTHVMFSTTVASKDMRAKGYGTEALEAKLKTLAGLGLGIKTTIAEDNEGGMGLCKKAGLQAVEAVQKTRSTGPYTAVVWTDPPKRLEA